MKPGIAFEWVSPSLREIDMVCFGKTVYGNIKYSGSHIHFILRRRFYLRLSPSGKLEILCENGTVRQYMGVIDDSREVEVIEPGRFGDKQEQFRQKIGAKALCKD